MIRHAPLLEIGAGTGFWARLLHDRGADLIASDPRIERLHFEHARYAVPGRWWDLQGKTAVRRWPERNIFCSWPSLNKTWLRQAAKAMRPGRVLLCVVEDATADERTWDYIEAGPFEKIASLELIGWHSCHDRLVAWKKRGTR